MGNKYFKKPDKLIYQSGNVYTQVDYILVRRCELQQVCNVKVKGSQECITQHKLLICDITLKTLLPRPYKTPVRRRIWKLRKTDVCIDYKEVVHENIQTEQSVEDDIDFIWS